MLYANGDDKLDLRMGAGVIGFQDIYPPFSNTNLSAPHLRADGSVREEDMKFHTGAAVSFM